MASESQVRGLVQNIIERRIGNEFGRFENYTAWYQDLLSSLLSRPPQDFDAAVSDGLPEVFEQAAKVGGSFSPFGYVKRTGRKLVKATIFRALSAAYWNGLSLEMMPYPGRVAAWSADYSAFASKVVDAIQGLGPVTIIDLGAGTGAVTFHVIRETAQRNIRGIKFVHIERDLEAMAFCEHFSRRYRLPIDQVMMDMAASLGHPAELAKLSERLGDGPKILVTRSALHPFYTTELYGQLFEYFLSAGVVAGVHWELNGIRTETFRGLLPQFKRRPAMKAHFDYPSDPFTFLTENASRLGIQITDRLELWPHFPPNHWPSYLSWAKDRVERRGC